VRADGGQGCPPYGEVCAKRALSLHYSVLRSLVLRAWILCSEAESQGLPAVFAALRRTEECAM
jgi:hypothetical protein